MDSLDLLKTNWEKEGDFIKFEKKEIVFMLKKRSSSIVKWILFISCLEFVIIGSLGLSSYFGDPDGFTIYEIIFQILAHIILFIFIYLFYKQFTSINVSNNTKSLCQGILKTRDLVFNYIKANFLLLGIQFVIGALVGNHFEEFKKGYSEGYNDGYNESIDIINSTSQNIDTFNNIMLWSVFLITAGILFLLLFIYYRVVYTGFLAKLKKNYNDLLAIDSENIVNNI